MSSPSKRRDTDLTKLMMNDYKVELNDDDMHNFIVHFNGPVDTLYEGGAWKVSIELPKDYPNKPPSVGFVNKIYHPNVDELTGSVCLNVFSESWSPAFDLVNVFEFFLPQLLTDPNPSDPFNGEASTLMLSDRSAYEARVKEYVALYAKPEDVGGTEEDKSTDKEVSEDASNLGDEASGPPRPNPR